MSIVAAEEAEGWRILKPDDELRSLVGSPEVAPDDHVIGTAVGPDDHDTIQLRIVQNGLGWSVGAGD